MINKKTFSYFGEEDAVEVVYSEDTMKEVMYEIFNYLTLPDLKERGFRVQP